MAVVSPRDKLLKVKGALYADNFYVNEKSFVVSQSAQLDSFIRNIGCSGTSGINLTLPAASGSIGDVFIIKNLTNFPVVVSGFNGELIDAVTGVTISGIYDILYLNSNGSQWQVSFLTDDRDFQIKLNNSDTFGYLEDKITQGSGIIINNNGNELQININYNELVSSVPNIYTVVGTSGVVSVPISGGVKIGLDKTYSPTFPGATFNTENIFIKKRLVNYSFPTVYDTPSGYVGTMLYSLGNNTTVANSLVANNYYPYLFDNSGARTSLTLSGWSPNTSLTNVYAKEDKIYASWQYVSGISYLARIQRLTDTGALDTSCNGGYPISHYAAITGGTFQIEKISKIAQFSNGDFVVAMDCTRTVSAYTNVALVRFSSSGGVQVTQQVLHTQFQPSASDVVALNLEVDSEDGVYLSVRHYQTNAYVYLHYTTSGLSLSATGVGQVVATTSDSVYVYDQATTNLKKYTSGTLNAFFGTSGTLTLSALASGTFSDFHAIDGGHVIALNSTANKIFKINRLGLLEQDFGISGVITGTNTINAVRFDQNGDLEYVGDGVLKKYDTVVEEFLDIKTYIQDLF